MAAVEQANLVFSPHPLMPAMGRQVYFQTPEPGESIADYLERLDLYLGSGPVVLSLNGEVVPRDEWPLIQLAENDLITVGGALAGGGQPGDDDKALRTLLTIAVIVAAPHASAALGLTGTQALVATSLIQVGGIWMVNTMLPPPEPEVGVDGESPTYSLAGSANRARPYAPLPLILGEHLVYPDHGARVHSEFVGMLGADQWLYQVFNFGLSDITLTDFKIGDTPLTEFADYNPATDLEVSADDGVLTLFPTNVDSITGGDLVFNGDYVQKTSSLGITSFEVDIVGSIYHITDRGSISGNAAVLELDYKLVGGTVWTPAEFTNLGQYDTQPVAGQVKLWNNDRSPFRTTIHVDVPIGQYDIRLRHVPNFPYPDPSDKHVATLSWATLRSIQTDDATDYTGQTRAALRMKATGQLYGTIDRVNAIARANCPVWNGSIWTVTHTKNPAWWFLWFARGKFMTGRRLFGAGLTDAELDIDQIKLWAVYCDDYSLTISAVFDRPNQSVESILRIIARAGRAAPSWASGKLGVVWDEPYLPVVGHFGMGNIRRGSFSVSYITSPDMPEEILVQFRNPALNWQQDEVRATVPGVSSPLRTATVQLFGCTDPDQAGREANLIAAEHAYRLRRISWEADIEGLAVSRGDVVTLSHDLTQWGHSGRLVAGPSTTQIVLDRPVPFTPAQQHYIGIRYPSGVYDIYDVVYQAGENDTLTLSGTTPLPTIIDNDPEHPPADYLWFFEPAATPGKKVKLLDVVPIDENTVRLLATDEDPAYYLAENNVYSWNPSAPTDTVPTITAIDVADTLIEMGGGFGVQIAVSWQTTGPYSRAVVLAGPYPSLLSERGRTYDNRFSFDYPNTSGDVVVQVLALNPAGQYGTLGIGRITHTIVGKNHKPQDVANPIITLTDAGAVLRWDAVPDVDLREYLIRTGTTWFSATDERKRRATEFNLGFLAAGPHDRLVKAIDTSDNESENASLASVTVQAPLAPVVSAVLDGGLVHVTWDVATADFPISEYEIRYDGTNFDDAFYQDRTKATAVTLRPTWTGDRTWRIAAIDAAGNVGAAGSVLVNIAAPSQPSATAKFVGELLHISWPEPASDLVIAGYRVAYGEVYASSVEVAEAKARGYTTRVDWVGNRTYWITPVDVAGNDGSPAQVQVIIVGATGTTIRAEVIDNNVQLYFSSTSGSLPIARYEIRRGAVVETAETLGFVQGTFKTVPEFEAGTYTYWAIPIDIAGNEGAPASVSAIVDKPSNFVLRNQFDLTFSGSATNALVKSDGHLLVPVNTTETWAEHFTNRGWTSPQDQVDAGFPRFIMPSTDSASYEEDFDMGAVVPGTQVSLNLTTNAISGSVTVTPTLSTRKLETDPWDVHTPGAFQVYASDFRYIRLQLAFAATGGDDLLEIVAGRVRAHVKLKTDAGKGNGNAGDADGTEVLFNESFVDVQNINVTPFTTARVETAVNFTDAPNPTGFKVLFFDATNGNRLTLPFGWNAEGN